jgi:HJR/Mrr/RecB family endonuclease
MTKRRRRSRHRGGPSNLPLATILIAVIVVVLLYQFGTRAPGLLIFLVLLIVALVVGMIWLRVQQHHRFLFNLQTLDDVLSLTPTQFEHATGELLQSLGYRSIHHTGGGGDLAADLICISPQGKRTVVQCKRYRPDNKVGTPVIQTFIGMIHIHHRAEAGIFVTTSSFTEPARKLAQQHGIWAIDGIQLAHLITQVQQQQRQQI